MSTEPKIFTKNYISKDNTFVATHGQASTPYLYDADPATKWLTSGANDDDTLVSIIVTFYEGSVAATRTIDRFMLLNHNLKTWNLYYWHSVDGWTALCNETADAAANTIKSFTAVATTSLKLEVTATQTVDAEKYIGEMIACALTMDIGYDFSSYEEEWREKKTSLTMADNSIHMIYMKFTANRYTKYGAKCMLSYLPVATLDNLQTIKEACAPFLFQPESITRPEKIYFVHWTNPWAPRYVTSYKGVGYQLPIEVDEV